LVVDRLGVAALSREEQAQLSVEARRVKEALSVAETEHLRVTLRGQAYGVEVTRAELVTATSDLIRRSILAVQKCLRDAGQKVEAVDGVILVGGATRMPEVRAAVGRLFGREPLTNLDPDEVVALGAAIQANLLAGNRASGDDWLLLDVIPLSLGVETMGGLVEKIIPRNSTLPVARAQEFTTFKDGQTALSIHVVQGERELVADCRSLGRFELRGIPPMVAGGARIRVTYQVDADGLLSVAAREMTSGVEASIMVKPAYGLAESDIARMLEEGFGAAQADMQARAVREQQVEAERLVAATRSALGEDAALLSSEERERLECLVREVASAAQGTDHVAIKNAIDSLARGTETFAARRMDEGIRRALSGRRLDEIL
jgi:molecular chaperone HscA